MFQQVFPKGSPLLVDVSEALLKVSESGKLQELENAMVASQKCVNMDWEEEDSSLSPNSFWVLFIITGGTSTVALLTYIAHDHRTLMNHWTHCKRRISRKVSDLESSTNSPNMPAS